MNGLRVRTIAKSTRFRHQKSPQNPSIHTEIRGLVIFTQRFWGILRTMLSSAPDMPL
jgi:hypothetical protein